MIKKLMFYFRANIAQGERNAKEKLVFLSIAEPQPVFAFSCKYSARQAQRQRKTRFS